MFSLMQNNNYLLSPSFYPLFFFKLLVVSRFLQNERPRTNNVKINQNKISNLTDRCCEEKCPTIFFFIHSSARCVSRPLITISGLPQNCMISPRIFFPSNVVLFSAYLMYYFKTKYFSSFSFFCQEENR